MSVKNKQAYGQMDPANSAANTSYYGGWNLGITVNFYSSAIVFYVIKKQVNEMCKKVFGLILMCVLLSFTVLLASRLQCANRCRLCDIWA